MRKERLELAGIPAILWGEPSDRLYLFVHGKMSSKDAAETLAVTAGGKGYQTLSWDLPQHGERDACVPWDVFTAMKELETVADYAFSRWKQVSLYACSIGAYMSLHACADRPFEKALFQSPIVDMVWLIHRMMEWFHVPPEELEAKGAVETPIDLLRWDYYQYIRSHPAEKWPVPTSILYGGRDEMQSIEVIQGFAERFGAAVTVSPDSEHAFMSLKDWKFIKHWLDETV